MRYVLLLGGREWSAKAAAKGVSMEVPQIILEYAKVILSWPVVVGTGLIIFVMTFKKPIEDFIFRIIKGNFYGVTVEAAAPVAQQKDIKLEEKTLTLTDPERYAVEHPKETVQEFVLLANKYQFERIYNMIYGTQIDLLEHLLSKGTDGDNYINLATFYQEFIRRSTLSNVQMADYIKFLETMRLVERTIKDGNLFIAVTAFGTDFLSYIKAQYGVFIKGKSF